MELVETAMENPLDRVLIEDGFLDFSSGVLVVERDCFARRVDREADLRVVALVGNLPDVKRLGSGVGEQPEEQDDGVGWGKTIRMDLLGGLV